MSAPLLSTAKSQADDFILKLDRKPPLKCSEKHGWVKKRGGQGCERRKASSRKEVAPLSFAEMYRKTLDSQKDSLRNNRNESAVIISEQKGVVYRGPEGSPVACYMDVDHISGNSVVHNHPTHVNGGRSNSFSPADIRIACKYQAKDIYAVNEQFEYRMSPGGKGWDEGFYKQSVAPSFKKHRKAVEREAIWDVLRGKLKVDAMGRIKNKNYDPHHQVWERVAVDTGLSYTKNPVSQRDDAVGDRPVTNLPNERLFNMVGTILDRAYSNGILDLTAFMFSPDLYKGRFIGLDRKHYAYEINLKNNSIKYKLDRGRTPKAALMEVKGDSRKRKTRKYECQTGISCGSGCISPRKVCRIRLSRVANQSEKSQVAALAQEVQEMSVEDRLRGKDIRELKRMASDASVWRYSELNKEGLVTVLADTYRKEQDGTERRARKTLNKRDKEVFVKPIDLKSRPKNSAEAQKRRNRKKATEKAFGILFPGGKNVIRDLSRAATIEDGIVAGLAGGILLLKMADSAGKEYENNYEKGVRKGAEEAVSKKSNMPDRQQEIENHFEGRPMTDAENKEFLQNSMGDYNGYNAALKHKKRVIEDIQTKGEEKLDEIAQRKVAREELSRQYEADKGRIEKKRDKANLKQELSGKELKRAEVYTDALKKKLSEVEDAIAVAKESPEKKANASSSLGVLRISDIKGELDNVSIPEEASKRIQDSVLKARERGATDAEIREIERNARLDETYFHLNKQMEANKSSREYSLEQLEKSRDALENTIVNNASKHLDKLRGINANNTDLVGSLNRDLASLNEKMLVSDPDDSGKYKIRDGLVNKMAKDTVEAETAKLRNKRKPKPLVPDFGEVKDGKPTAYQAWVMQKYMEQAPSLNQAGEKGQAIAREKIRAGMDLSKKAFRKELNERGGGLIVVGSQSNTAQDAGNKIQSILRKNGAGAAYSTNVENTFSAKATKDKRLQGVPYLNRMLGTLKKSIPASNRIPGLNVTTPNDDATALAGQIMAMSNYGLTPKVVSHGIGGSVVRESMDIIRQAEGAQSPTLKKMQSLFLGSPQFAESKYKAVRSQDRMVYGGNDVLAQSFGKGKSVAGVKGNTYDDYLDSNAVQDMLVKFLKEGI